MVILVPWKPVVVAWCLLATMLWLGYVGYSVFGGKNPFAAAQRHSYHLQTHRTADNGTRELVTVTLDLRSATTGPHFLSTTREQDQASYYYPLDIR